MYRGFETVACARSVNGETPGCGMTTPPDTPSVRAVVARAEVRGSGHAARWGRGRGRPRTGIASLGEGWDEDRSGPLGRALHGAWKRHRRPMGRDALTALVAQRTWYVLKVERGAELRVMEDMEALGVAPLVPTEIVRRRAHRFATVKHRHGVDLRRAWEDVHRVLMPGYVIVGCAHPHDVYAARYACPEVMGVLGIDGRAGRLAVRDVVEIARAHPNGLRFPDRALADEAATGIAVGDTVRLSEHLGFGAIETPVVTAGERRGRIGVEAVLFGAVRVLEIDALDADLVARAER